MWCRQWYRQCALAPFSFSHRRLCLFLESEIYNANFMTDLKKHILIIITFFFNHLNYTLSTRVVKLNIICIIYSFEIIV